MKHESRLAGVGLDWSTVAEIASFTGMQPRSVYNLAVGLRPWKHCRKPHVVQHLYEQKKWRPEGGRQAVHRWLAIRALKSQREAESLRRTLAT